MDKLGTITNFEELQEAISILEDEQSQAEILLKEQFNITYESLKPINIIKGTVKEFVTAPDFKNNLLNTTMGLFAGYFSKKLAIGSHANIFKRILGGFLQLGITTAVSKNADEIRTKFKEVLSGAFENHEKQ